MMSTSSLYLILHEAIKDLNDLDTRVVSSIESGRLMESTHSLGRIIELSRKIADISRLLSVELLHRDD